MTSSFSPVQKFNNRIDEITSRLSRPYNFVEVDSATESDTESIKNLQKKIAVETHCQVPNDSIAIKRKKAG